MTEGAREKLENFLSRFNTKGWDVADFGGVRTARYMKAVFSRHGIGSYKIYDLNGGDYKMDLCKEWVGERYDFINCTDTLEHVRDPFFFGKNLEQALKVGGRAFIAAPFVWKVHGDDYYRYTTTGLINLFSENIKVLEQYYLYQDTNVHSVITIERVG